MTKSKPTVGATVLVLFVVVGSAIAISCGLGFAIGFTYGWLMQ